jgi:uncharacterized protein YigE (DUF2233 family)
MKNEPPLGKKVYCVNSTSIVVKFVKLRHPLHLSNTTLVKITWIVLLGFLGVGSTVRGQGPWHLQEERVLSTQDSRIRLVTKSIIGGREIRLTFIWPDPEKTRLTVLDNRGNTQWLNQAMTQRHCLAGVNGGYFQPDTTPLGLVISEGRKIHGFHRSRLLSGLVVVRDNQLGLLRSAELSPAMKLSDALQAGPFLIDQGKPVAGLHNKKRARRTLVLADQSGRYGIAVVQTPVTLAELAHMLATPGILHEIALHRALNMDGGSSSALWARTTEGEVHLRGLKRVRNFLCVQKRS